MLIKSIKLVAVLAFTVFLFSCSNVKSSYDYDQNFNFSTLKTYEWDTKPSAAFASANPLVAKRIVAAIERNMKSKGMVAAENADMTLSYQVSLQKKLISRNVSGAIGMSVGRSNRGSITLSSGNQLREKTEGTLMIDMIANSNNSLIWRSTTIKPITNRDQSAGPEAADKRVNEMVKAIFENFPPKKQ